MFQHHSQQELCESRGWCPLCLWYREPTELFLYRLEADQQIVVILPTCEHVPGLNGSDRCLCWLQCTLAYKKLGINPIVMSAGELESGNAGEPAKLVRQRYREASDVIKKGKLCSLFINDLDAGELFQNLRPASVSQQSRLVFL